MAVTLYITVIGLPKIFSCVIFFAKLTCIYGQLVYFGHFAISQGLFVVHRFDYIFRTWFEYFISGRESYWEKMSPT